MTSEEHENRAGQRRRPTGLFLRTIGQLPRSLLTSNNVAINSKRRKIPLTFLPPSTNSPLFVYSNDYDQRSFLSLCSGSHIDDDSCISPERNDNESVSTFRSLPSTLEVNDDEIESIHQWLDEERERRSLLSNEEDFEYYGAVDDSNNTILKRADKLFPGSSRRSSVFSLEAIIRDEEDEDFAHETVTFRKEINKLFHHSIPLIITFFLEQIFSLVCVVFVGHLGTEELAAVSMASMTSTIVLAIFEGIATSLDTLCPQAYGAGQHRYVGIHTQRCSFFSLMLFIPAAMFWYFSGYFLSFMIRNDGVLILTQKFLRILIFAGPPYILFENGKRFLQAQGIFDAGTYILFITAPLNILLNWLLVYSKTFGLGYIGAPIASVINFWAMFILLVFYIVFIDGSECWDGFTIEAFYHWYDLSKLAIPGIVMLLAESLAYEILTLFASNFGTSALATQSGLSSIVSLLYMIPFALSVASSTRIANYVGGENILGGKTAINVGFLSSILVAFINSAIVYFASEHLALLFTDDKEVISMFTKLSPLISVFVIFDSLSCVANGILRALALQMIGGTLSLVGYYIIAVPLAVFLSFNLNMQLLGLWLGNGAGLFLISITEVMIIYNLNWEKVIKHAKNLTLHEDA
jgi:MATE family multidrug resistance protein